MARPSWTLSRAATECQVSKSTLKRRLEANVFPNAARGQRGQWLVPVEDLISAGFAPRPTPPDEPGLTEVTDRGQRTIEPDHDLGQSESSLVKRVHELEVELAQERATRHSAEQLASERSERITDLRQALKMLEPPQPTQPETSKEASSPPAPRPGKTESRRGLSGWFRRRRN